MVAPGVRDRNIVGKSLARETRKALVYTKVPVPQTDTGRWDEYSKANGRRVVKELGKLRPTGEGLLRNSANWPRNFGIRGAYESRPQ